MLENSRTLTPRGTCYCPGYATPTEGIKFCQQGTHLEVSKQECELVLGFKWWLQRIAGDPGTWGISQMVSPSSTAVLGRIKSKWQDSRIPGTKCLPRGKALWLLVPGKDRTPPCLITVNPTGSAAPDAHSNALPLGLCVEGRGMLPL